MLITLPMFSQFLPVSALVSLFLIVLLVVSAGITNPLSARSAVLDTFIAGAALVVFGYSAVASYPLRSSVGVEGWLFSISMLLSLIFFAAFYYSLKTVRGFKQDSKAGDK